MVHTKKLTPFSQSIARKFNVQTLRARFNWMWIQTRVVSNVCSFALPQVPWDLRTAENVIGRAVQLSWARADRVFTGSVSLRPRDSDLTSISGRVWSEAGLGFMRVVVLTRPDNLWYRRISSPTRHDKSHADLKFSSVPMSFQSKKVRYRLRFLSGIRDLIRLLID